VNFAKTENNTIKMRTFDRGVEDETLACGTGATAVAISAHNNKMVDVLSIPVSVMGGELNVSFEKVGTGYQNIWLTGPTEFVFEGTIKN
jgi:diaminopimelate epimerase